MARNNNRRQEPKDDGLIKKTVSINKVTKVTKGAKTMRFAALVVCGNGKDMVGIGLGKAREVSEAIEKATRQAERSMVKFSLLGDSIPHQITGVFGRGKVLLIPAEEGTGVIAGGPVRTILEVTGIKNIRTKCIGTTNPINCVKATLDGLVNLRTKEEVAAIRGIDVDSL